MRLHTFTHTVADASNRTYLVHAEGEQQPGGEWFGWLVFEPVSGGPTLRTGRETTQSSREDLDYWVSGLEVVYLDGALTRASPTG